MFCRKCGAELRLNAKFCAKCGTPAPTKAPETAKPVDPVKPVDPSKEVKTVLTREEPRKVIYVPPTESAPKKEEDAAKLVITMSETKASSSNGQFNEWFSEPGDLD